MRVTFPFEITKFFDTKINIETGKRELVLKKNYAFAVEENFKAIKKYFNDLINTDNIIPQGLNANIVIEPASFNADNLIEPNTLTLPTLGKEWTNWTPSYDCGGDMTITSVSTYVSKYCRIGKIIFFVISFAGITGGTASPYIKFTAPIEPYASIPLTCYGGGCYIWDGNTYQIAGTWSFDTITPSKIAVFRYDEANFGLGITRGATVQGFYQID